MGRSPVVVRPLAASEIDALAPLWAEFLAQEQSPVPGGVDIAERVRERILASDERLLAGRRPTYRVVVAPRSTASPSASRRCRWSTVGCCSSTGGGRRATSST